MKRRAGFTRAMSLSVRSSTYDRLKNAAKERGVSVADLVRIAVADIVDPAPCAKGIA